MKLYIAVLDQVPSFMVPTLVAHTMLGAHMKFCQDYDYHDWLINSFKKVVVKVNQKEFDKIKLIDEVYLGHENKTLDGVPSCAILLPSNEYPNVIKFAKLWTP